MLDKRKENCKITTWKKFNEFVRSRGCNLLAKLDQFSDSILVTGCQRSGTTMLSRIITQSDGMVKYWFGTDDELDAALILSGDVDIEPKGRYCFQTTYLNECYHEYFTIINCHKIIWVLRNPFSVVYSILHNWRRAALNRLFKSCGTHLLSEGEKRRYERFGLWGINRLLRACLAYKGKVSQVFELRDRIAPDRIMIIDYDDLVTDKNNMLPLIYRFIDLEYKNKYSNMIHSKSLNKAERLSRKETSIVENLCMPVYLKAKSS